MSHEGNVNRCNEEVNVVALSLWQFVQILDNNEIKKNILKGVITDHNENEFVDVTSI